MKTVSMMRSLMRNQKASAENARNIAAARDKNRREEEMFKLKKRDYETKIEQRELAGDISQAQADFSRKQFKVMSDLWEKQNKAKGMMIGNAEQKNTQTMKANQQAMMEVMPYMQAEYGAKGYTSKQGFKYQKKDKPTATASDKVLGDLQSGGSFDEDTNSLNEFVDRSEAENYANANLGMGWRKKFPKAVGAIDKNFGPNVGDFPKNIKTKRAAYEYLTKTKGMSDEKARTWIEENN